MHNKKIFIILIFLILVSILASYNYYLYKKVTVTKPLNVIEQREDNENFNLDYYKEKYSNNDIIAHLEIPALFDILITKSNDNKYYLNHSISKEPDKKGTEFMDYRNTINSKQINIYGHNSKTYNLPFVKLENFLNKEFFKENEYIFLENDKVKSKYHILLIKEIKNNYEHMKVDIDETNIINHLNKLKENSINIRELNYSEDSSILILQTCSYNQKDSYYIIVAIKED